MTTEFSSIEESGLLIARANTDWLEAEVVSSGEGRNKYLDGSSEDQEAAEVKFEDVRRRLTLGYDHPDNWSSAKHSSHMDRYPIWWEAFAQDPSDDYQSARILFNALMQVSGTYRNQCYLEASSQQDYQARRSGILGLQPEGPVLDRLRVLLPESGDFSAADIGVESLDERRKKVMALGETAIKRMLNRLRTGYDMGVQDSVSSREMITTQYNWLAFATDCVTLAAKIREGRLAAVPFLEAKSISDDPQVIYPLAA